MAKKKTIYQQYFPYITKGSNYVHLDTLEGKKYKIPTKVFVHLIEARNRVEQELDAPFVITGSVGAGKSNIEIGMGGTWENLFYKRDFTLNDLYWRAEDISTQMDRYDNFSKVLCFDEAVQGSSNQDNITKIGKIYSNKLDTKRFKKHLIISCIPNLRKFTTNALQRCIAWYHVELHKDKRTGKYYKGRLKMFSIKEAVEIATWLNKDRYNMMENHPIVKKRNWIQLDNYMDGLWFSKDDYNKVKSEKTSEQEEEENEKDNKVMRQRDNLVSYITNNYNETRKSISIAMEDITPRGVGDILHRMEGRKNI